MGKPEPELADVARLARRYLNRAVETARAEDRPLRRILLDHLGPDAAARPTVSATWPAWDQVNIQVGVDAWLAASPARGHEVVGISGGGGMSRHMDLTITDFLQPGRNPLSDASASGVITEAVPSGPGGQARACVVNGIYLVRDGADRLAFMIRPVARGVRSEILLQVTGSRPAAAEAALASIRELALAESLFRGQVLSFRPELLGPGYLLDFLDRPAVSRSEVILPSPLLEEIERQVLGVARHSARLLASGQHLKRGILLYGAPGTGKTHTVSYLLGRLPTVTAVVISGRALGAITQACSLARSLQPAMVIVEDVDLIAEERTARSGQQPLLFQLLNEMEGLHPSDNVTFLLTTNRSDLLEPALAARPGRVDLAAELPLPSAEARLALLRLYQGRLILDVTPAGLDSVIERTEGVTAAFLRELLRKAALLAAESDAADAGGPAGPARDDAPIRVAGEHLAAALDRLFDERGKVTRALLGGGRRGDAGAGAVPTAQAAGPS